MMTIERSPFQDAGVRILETATPEVIEAWVSVMARLAECAPLGRNLPTGCQREEMMVAYGEWLSTQHNPSFVDVLDKVSRELDAKITDQENELAEIEPYVEDVESVASGSDVLPAHITHLASELHDAIQCLRTRVQEVKADLAEDGGAA